MNLAEQMQLDAAQPTAPAQSPMSLAAQMAQDAAAPPEPRNVQNPARSYEGSEADVAGGIGETALRAVSGVVAPVVGGWRGLWDLASGQGSEKAAKDVQETTNALTYEPRTQTGQDIAAGIAKVTAPPKPGQWGYAGTQEGAGEIGNRLGGPIAGAIASALPTAIATVAGSARPEPGLNNAAIPEATSQVGTAVDQGRGAQPVPVSARPVLGGGAAVANSNPYPVFTGEEDVRGAFPQVKISKIGEDVPQAEQTARANIAAQIVPGRVRPSVLNGNSDTMRTELALANAANPTPTGQLLKGQIAEEQNGLSEFAKQRVAATGASPTLINDYSRGAFVTGVLGPEDGMMNFLNTEKQKAYANVFAQGNTVPAVPTNTSALLSSPEFLGRLKQSEMSGLASGTSDLLDAAMGESFGGSPGGTVAALERLRQTNNASWTPKNSQYIGQINAAIDKDIDAASTLSGNSSLLSSIQDARKIHQAQQGIISSPGIKSLVGEMDPNGVPMKGQTPPDQVMQKLSDMPFDQWRHVHDTMESLGNGNVPGLPGMEVPDDLRSAARQGVNEMSGSLVREVQRAGGSNVGGWNANSVNNTLNARAQKLGVALPPDEQQAMHTLNYAGQMMPSQLSYEGAAQQARRMGQAGLLERSLPQVGAAAGALVPVPGSEWAGGKAGEWAAGKMSLNRLMKQATALDAQMEANAKLGTRP